jgi:DNA-directed RNA polymerase I subunit RPA12
MWPFCPHCGTILDAPEFENVKCTYCPFVCKFSEMMVPEVITKSAPRPKPTWIVDDSDEQEAKDNENAENAAKNGAKHATIEETCPKCNHPELFFYTMQLRSVDEGSTVFYECPKCAYKYNLNN